MGGTRIGRTSLCLCLVVTVLASFGDLYNVVECRGLLPPARSGDQQVKKPQWLFDGNPNSGWFGGGGGGGGFGGGFGGGGGKSFGFGHSFSFGKGYGFSFGPGTKPPGYGGFRKPTSGYRKP